MRRLACAVAAAAALSGGVSAQQASKTPGSDSASIKPAASHQPAKTRAAKAGAAGLGIEAQNQLVAQYCATCHSERGKAGGLVLAGFDAATITNHPETAEKMIRKLRAGMMPPPTARRPDADVMKAFVDSLETRIDAAAASAVNPGWRPFQRLNRAEYARAVRDLLGIEIDVNSFLPPDTISSGFDNIADVQNFSPTLMEGYLRAASQISRLAVGDRGASATSA